MACSSGELHAIYFLWAHVFYEHLSEAYKILGIVSDECPEAVHRRGIHVPMEKWQNGQLYWDYQSVKNAFDS